MSADVEKKSVFNEYEAWTDEASAIGKKFRAALKEVFQEAVENGVKIREVEMIAHSEVSMTSCEMIVRASIKRSREAKKNNE